MINYEKLKENVEAGIISYDNFVKIVNNDSEMDIETFYNLMIDEIAEKLYLDDFKVLEDYVNNIKESIESELKCDLSTDYIYNPHEDGGIYTGSFICNGADMGLIGDLLNITVVAEIRIDFRPSCYAYVGVHVIKDDDKKSLLGDYNYIHYEIGTDGQLGDYSLESM